MAQASSGGGDDLPKWAKYIQPAINTLLVIIIVAVAGTYMLAVGTAKVVDNHEGRIVKVEDKLSRQDVLAEKIDTANRQMEDLKLALRETNQRLDAERDRRERGR